METETSDNKYRWSHRGRTWGRWTRSDGGANKTNKQTKKKQKQRKSNERRSEGKMAIQEIERRRSRQALE